MDNTLQNLPPLDWLRTFEAAARHEKFSAAAQELHLTQAAVSQHIRKLEAWLGVSLFTRLPRSVQLTVQGDAYLPHVRKALEVLTRGTGDLFAARRVRRVSIASPASFCNLWLAPHIGDCRRKLPHIRLQIATILRPSDYDAVDADMEIRFGSVDRNWGASTLLFRERLTPVCSPALAQTLHGDDWLETPLLSLTGPRSGWAEWHALTQRSLPNNAGVHFDSLTTALEAARAGAGILLASLPLVETLFNRGELQRLSPLELEMPEGYWLVQPPSRRVDDGVDAVHGWIQSAVASS